MHKNAVVTIKQYCNQGSVKEYMAKRAKLLTGIARGSNNNAAVGAAVKVAGLPEREAELLMRSLCDTCERVSKKVKYHGCLHPNNVFVHSGHLVLGEPLIYGDKAVKKFKD
jgi:hypothetical protein